MKTIFELNTKLEPIMFIRDRYSIEQLLTKEVSVEDIEQIQNILWYLRDNIRLNYYFHRAADIGEDIKINGSINAWEAIIIFLDKNVKCNHNLEYFFLELLIYLYDPIPDLFHIEKDVLLKVSGIENDKEGLLKIDFNWSDFEIRKEGILIDDLLIFYDSALPGQNISHGFVEELLKSILSNKENVDYFGIAINKNVRMNRKYWGDVFTKAYIRGPKGLSTDKLNSISFPEDLSGVVTEHKRIDDDQLLDFVCPVDRIEIMWTCDNKLKGFQLEELKPIPAKKDMIKCKYVHSQWDCNSSTISHFDGANRGYQYEEYENRLLTDIKKYKGKTNYYKKTFKLNGNIKLEVWQDLIVRYFDPDELVLEYFGGPKDDY